MVLYTLMATLVLVQADDPSDVPPAPSAEVRERIEDAGGRISEFRNGTVSVSFLRGEKVNDELMQDVGTIAGLRRLSLYRSANITDNGLKHLAGLKHLTHLRLTDCRISDAGVAHLAGLPLVDLDLSRTNISDAGIPTLAKIPSLTRLGLYSTRLTDQGLAKLTQLPNLERLTLGRGQITDAGLAHLAKFPKLRSLTLSSDFTDAGIKHLAKVPTLHDLNLWGCTGVTGTGLQVLTELPQLESLSLMRINAGDEAMTPISSLKNLRRLMLDSEEITDDGIVELSNLKKLESLELMTTSITDSGMEVVKELPKLSSLTVCRNITDAGLEKLQNVKSLQRLSLISCDISEKALNAYQKAQPQVHVFHSKPRDSASATTHPTGPVAQSPPQRQRTWGPRIGKTNAPFVQIGRQIANLEMEVQILHGPLSGRVGFAQEPIQPPAFLGQQINRPVQQIEEARQAGACPTMPCPVRLNSRMPDS